MKSDGTTFFTWIVIILSIAAPIAVAWIGTNNLIQESPQILAREGYSNVQIQGYSFWGCGRDLFSVGFVGAKNDQPVSGNVCQSFGSGAIVRTR